MSSKNSKYEQVVCPRCGRYFTCTQRVNCWCFWADFSPNVKDHLSKNFEGCVCEKCIDELTQQLK